MLWVRDSDQLIEEPDTMASCHRRNNGVPFSTGGALQDKWELRLPEDISNLGSHLLQFVNAGESKISFPQGMVWTVNVWGCDAANNSSVQTNSLSPSVVICGDTLGAADGRKVYLSDRIHRSFRLMHCSVPLNTFMWRHTGTNPVHTSLASTPV